MPLFMLCKNGHRYDVEAHDGGCPFCKRGIQFTESQSAEEHFQRRNLFRILDSITDMLRSNKSKRPVEPASTNFEPISPAPVVPTSASEPAHQDLVSDESEGPESFNPKPVNRDWSSRRHFQGMSPRELESERRRALRKTKQAGVPKSGYAVLAVIGIIAAVIAGGYLISENWLGETGDKSSAGRPTTPAAQNPQISTPGNDGLLVPTLAPTLTPTPTRTVVPTRTPQWLDPSPPLALNEVFDLPEKEALHALKTQSSECKITAAESQAGASGSSYKYDITVLNQSDNSIFSWSLFPPLGGSFPNDSFNSVPNAEWSMSKLPVGGPPYDEYLFTTDSDPIQANGGMLTFAVGTRTSPVTGGSAVMVLTETEVCAIRDIQVPGN